MKKILYKNILIIICYWLFTAGCHTGKEITKTESDRLKLTEAENKEYQYALTEATKYKIFGNLKQATALYEKCLQVNPLSDVAHYQIGNINMILGNYENAKIHTRKALEINERNFWYMMQLAQLYNIENQLDSLKYLSLEGMLEAMFLPKEKFCTACFTGDYPVRPLKRQTKNILERGR